MSNWMVEHQHLQAEALPAGDGKAASLRNFPHPASMLPQVNQIGIVQNKYSYGRQP